MTTPEAGTIAILGGVVLVAYVVALGVMRLNGWLDQRADARRRNRHARPRR